MFSWIGYLSQSLELKDGVTWIIFNEIAQVRVTAEDSGKQMVCQVSVFIGNFFFFFFFEKFFDFYF